MQVGPIVVGPRVPGSDKDEPVRRAGRLRSGSGAAGRAFGAPCAKRETCPGESASQPKRLNTTRAEPAKSIPGERAFSPRIGPLCLIHL